MSTDDTELNTAEKPNFCHIFEANLNNDLSKLKEYLDYNILNLNKLKCSFMLIGTLQTFANINTINFYITNIPLRLSS